MHVRQTAYLRSTRQSVCELQSMSHLQKSVAACCVGKIAQKCSSDFLEVELAIQLWSAVRVIAISYNNQDKLFVLMIKINR